MSPSILLALGGNALDVDSKESDNPREDFIVASKSMENVANLIEHGMGKMIITHGNGPQVGRIFLQQELTKKEFSTQTPLDVCVADTQGRIGLILQNVFSNICRRRGIDKKIVTIITQVLVDPHDPSFQNPSKPIGAFYSKKKALELEKTRHWIMKEQVNKKYRRVVPSPKPLEVVEKETFCELMKSNFITIGAGGGGVPVINKNNRLEGIEAVIDKDRTSCLLALAAGIDILVILTEATNVFTDFNRPQQKALKDIKIKELEELYNAGQFPPGSMGPKVEAAIDFIKGGGKKTIIANLFDLLPALKGEKGTHITL